MLTGFATIAASIVLWWLLWSLHAEQRAQGVKLAEALERIAVLESDAGLDSSVAHWRTGKEGA